VLGLCAFTPKGYLACSMLLNENSDLLKLIVQQLKNDLSKNDEVVQSLALNCIGT
jgi:AP-2 complex subunit alpha